MESVAISNNNIDSVVDMSKQVPINTVLCIYSFFFEGNSPVPMFVHVL